jgi:thymidine kinase
MNNGKVIFFTGCMFSGKSFNLIETVQKIGRSFECFKPMVDTRGGAFIVSRNTGRKLNARVIEDITAAEKSRADVIVLDEIQFFRTEGFGETINSMKNKGKTVLMAGLDRIANGEYWKIYPIALELADEVVQLTAVCDLCGKMANYTKKILGGSEEIQIEGDGVKYIPTCEYCFRLK